MKSSVSAWNARFLTIALAAMVLGVTAYGSARNASRPAPEKTRIAVITLKRLLAESKENEDLQKNLTKMRDEQQAALTDFKKQVDDKTAVIEKYTKNKNSEEYFNLRLEREELLVNAKNRGDALAARYDLASGKALKQVYDKIVDATQQVATQDGWEMVIVDDTGIETPEIGGFKEISSPILTRQIIYRHNDLDITDAVLQKMNSDYGAGVGTKKPKK